MAKLIDDEIHTAETILKKYKSLVHSIAQRFCGGDFHHQQDLAQVGFMGLLKAFESFNSEKDIKFITYAYKYVRGYMRNLNRESGLIHVPADVKLAAWKIDKQNLWDSEDSEISTILGITLKKVESCRIFFGLKSVLSMDAQSDDDNRDMYNSYIFEQDLSNLSASQYLEKLNERELFIVAKLMSDDSYSNIGRELGVSKVRVGQIVKGIREKVKVQIQIENL